MEGTLLLENIFWLAVQLFVYLALGVYVVFALVVIKQVRLMTATLELGFESTIRLFSYIHLFLSIAVLLIALLIL